MLLVLMLALWVALAMAKPPRGIEVEICIQDGDGRALGAAQLAVVDSDLHRVNERTGCWAGDTVYQRGGAAVTLQKGVVLNLIAAAPGFTPEPFSWTVGARHLDVVLEPVAVALDPAMFGVQPAEALALPEGDARRLAVEGLRALNNKDPQGAKALAERALAAPAEPQALALAVKAVAATQLWAAAEEKYLADPSPNKRRDEALRASAFEAARAWMPVDHSGQAWAFGLCVAATVRTAACQ